MWSQGYLPVISWRTRDGVLVKSFLVKFVWQLRISVDRAYTSAVLTGISAPPMPRILSYPALHVLVLGGRFARRGRYGGSSQRGDVW